MKAFKPLLISWKLIRLLSHMLTAMLLAALFLRKGIQGSALASRLFTWWNRDLCSIFKAHISTIGTPSNDATLYVMNHISWFDIPALASRMPLHFLSKAEIRSWPVIGWLSHRAGTLFIQRGAAGAAQKSLAEITHCLKQGGSVVLFPEGTTSDGKHLKKFHARLYQAAIDAGVKIQPVALRYPYGESINPYVPYIDDMTFVDSVIGLTRSHPLKVELHFLQPIDDHLNSTEEVNRQQLAEKSYQAIQQIIVPDTNESGK